MRSVMPMEKAFYVHEIEMPFRTNVCLFYSSSSV